jgi:hypothetical protein
MSSEEIEKIASDEVQDFIFAHAQEDEKKLLLKHKFILGLPAPLIAQQIAARRKAENKLPQFYKTRGIVYPPSLNLEQSSSEAAAKFKAAIVSEKIDKNAKLADLTGGLGIDSFYLSQNAESLDYVESNAELLNLVRHNHSLLTTKIRYHNKSSEDFLTSSNQKFDLVFIDPSRRDSKARKVFSLADCSPDITQLLPHLLTKTDFVLLKASPLLDIKQGLKELTNVEKVIVVSVSNECKELLFQISKDFIGETSIETYNLDAGGKVTQSFNFSFSEEENASSKFNSPQKYLYEPNASILKSGAFKSIGVRFKLDKIQVNTHLYTSNQLEKDFPGRVFEIEQLSFDPKSLANNKANIICRNYPLTPEELKKKLKLKDGGEKFVIAFSGQSKKHVILGKLINLSIKS